MSETATANKLSAETDVTAAALIDTVSSLVTELQPSRSGVQAVGLDSSLDVDLGLDSLARVELLARIERQFGIALSERVFTEAETPRDLLRAVLSATARGGTTAAPEVSDVRLERIAANPTEAQTLLDVLEWHVAAHGDRAHIQLFADEGEGERLSYRQLRDGAKKLAAGLQQKGIQPGEPVAIMLPTCIDYFFCFFAILMAGGIPVPIYPPTRPTQLEDHLRRHARILDNCRARLLLTVPEAKKVARLLMVQLETMAHVVTVEELAQSGKDFTPPRVMAQDTAFIQYTSGSTGNPKGVVLSQANLLTNIRAMGAVVKAESTDVFVSWLPLYHDMGLIGAWFGSLYYGALLVVFSPLAFLTRPQRWLQAIHRYGGTLSAAPNFGYELCLHRLEDKDLEGLDLGSWRAAFNGAEAVSPETVLAFSKRFGKYGFRSEAMMPVYGLAENSVGLAFPPLYRGVLVDRIKRRPFMEGGQAIPATADEANALRFVACGPALSGHEIRIVDDASHELPERQEGRLQFRGPSATRGYQRNAEATRDLFDGAWLNSGDLAYIVGGDVYVTGRIKDIIIRAGRNLYPHEVEEAVGEIAGIRKGRVAVFGVPDRQTHTERLVVLAETRETNADVRERMRAAINAAANNLIGGPADEVILSDPNTVLKTSSGKIRRSACRELYELGISKQNVPQWRQLVHLALAGFVPQFRRFRGNLGRWLWGTYARALFWILAPLVWLLVAILPRMTWRWVTMRVGTQLLVWATGTPFKVLGLESLPPVKQPCIFVANHASYMDGPLLIVALGRTFSFVAKTELSRERIAGRFLRRIQAEFVERFDISQSVEDTQRVMKTTQSGRSLLIFPEGTFTRIPGLLPFHMGAFLTAAETGLPVVPVAIRGTRSLLRADTRFPRRTAVTITIGSPIEPSQFCDHKHKDPWSVALALRDAARAELLQSCGEPDLAGEKPHLQKG